jgi:factor associated with neutral sphingomyelinase activation
MGESPRFTPLLLDPGEYYFEDYAAVLFHPGDSDPELIPVASRVQLKGWFRICSNSILFDPQNQKYPIFRAKYRDVISVDPIKAPGSENLLVVQIKRTILCKENNKASPYSFKELGPNSGSFVFSFSITSLTSVLPFLRNLIEISNSGDRKMISASLETIIRGREMCTSFNTSWLVDHRETPQLSTPILSSRITPLLKTPGWLQITDYRLYFQPLNNSSLEPVHKFDLSLLKKVFCRRYSLRHVGLELFFDDSYSKSLEETDVSGWWSMAESLFLAFSSKEERDSVLSVLLSIRGDSIMGGVSADLELMKSLWVRKEISNFDYLMFLNQFAGRTCNDLTQYPVVPWVISDYDCTSLDLNDRSVFRDLSKPIGALNPERLETLKLRKKEMSSVDKSFNFLYGTHYSTPAYVLFYLVRALPEYMLCLQNGRFDEPDRLFCSIADCWKSVLTNPADVKELIPQFYGFSDLNLLGMTPRPGDFLRNLKDLDLGLRHNGRRVGDVELPKWADSPDDFVTKSREALESENVSAQLHNWIDLIFGYRNSGPEAEKADNLFYYLTYEGAVDIEKITDPVERLSIELQINEFGQTPRQIFTAPHPRRGSGTLMETVLRSPFTLATKEDKEIAEILDEIEKGKGTPIERKMISFDLGERITSFSGSSIKSSNWGTYFESICIENKLDYHKGPISSIALPKNGSTIFTITEDSAVKVYSVSEHKIKRSTYLSSMSLSSCALVEHPSGDSDLMNAFVGGWDNNIYVYSVAYGNVSKTFSAHDDAVSSVAFANDVLVSGSWDTSVKVWDVSPGSNFSKHCVCVLSEHECEVRSVDLKSDSALAVSGSDDGMVALWDLKMKDAIRLMERHHEEEITCVRFSPNGDLIASCSSNGELRVTSVRSASCLLSETLASHLVSLCLSDEFMIVAEQSGRLSLWNLMTMTQVSSRTLSDLHEGSKISCLSVSEDGSMIVAGLKSSSGSVRLLSTKPLDE